MHQHSISRTAKLAFCSALFFSTACQADGTLRFRGAITEAACTVSATQTGFDSDSVRRAMNARNNAKVEGGPVHLKMNCNSNQTMQLSFEGRPSNRIGFDAGMAGVEMVLSRAGKDLRPGEAIPVALTGKQEKNIDIATALRHVAGAASNNNSNGNKLDGAILVSMNYH